MEAPPPGSPPLRFLFDQHVSGPALRQLREKGIDVVHVAEVGLAAADDPDIFRWSIQEARIIVTRNYCDFAPLVEIFSCRGETFPGVLFYSTSVRQSDVGHHVRALLDWIEAAGLSSPSMSAKTTSICSHSMKAPGFRILSRELRTSGSALGSPAAVRRPPPGAPATLSHLRPHPVRSRHPAR